MRILTIIVTIFWTSLGLAQDLEFATLKDFKTQSGVVITDAKIGYRTIGVLNAKKDNAVLWPTWFTGTTEELIEFGLVENIIEKEGFYLILVDALGNGVSSSPSNTSNYPDITIRDMVNSQYQLLTKHLGITKLKAVIGISMGGMQTYEWLVTYPNFMKKAINIIGTPKQSFYDLLFWNTQAEMLEKALNNQGDLSFAKKRVMDMFTINLYTPEYLVNNVKLEKATDFMNEQYAKMIDPRDYLAQLKAMIGHDIYKSARVSEEQIRSVIHAKMLVVVNKQDHMVNPTNAIALAKNLNSKLRVLNTQSGHAAPFIDHIEIKKEVAPFLAK